MEKMKLMYITNDCNLAKIAEINGVDWIFVDLEINGKEDRQGHLNTVISRHKLSDVYKVKQSLVDSELLVRINPINEFSSEEINSVIEAGADIIMLPYFKSSVEVNEFLNIIDNRVKTCLLVETSEAVENIDEILKLNGINYIHIGLNDLHLSYNLKFMFELLINGTVEKLSKKIKDKKIPFGFGGISKIGEGKVPASKILLEHYRLKSEMVILSRGFYNFDHDFDGDYEKTNKHFKEEVIKIRNHFDSFNIKENKKSYLEINKKELNIEINNIVDKLSKVTL